MDRNYAGHELKHGFTTYETRELLAVSHGIVLCLILSNFYLIVSTDIIIMTYHGAFFSFF